MIVTLPSISVSFFNSTALNFLISAGVSFFMFVSFFSIIVLQIKVRAQNSYVSYLHDESLAESYRPRNVIRLFTKTCLRGVILASISFEVMPIIANEKKPNTNPATAHASRRTFRGAIRGER